MLNCSMSNQKEKQFKYKYGLNGQKHFYFKLFNLIKQF